MTRTCYYTAVMSDIASYLNIFDMDFGFSSTGRPTISASPLAVSCANGVEPAGYIKTGGFLDELSPLKLRNNDCIMELQRYWPALVGVFA